jgi:hypothetical protein
VDAFLAVMDARVDRVEHGRIGIERAGEIGA